MNRLRIRLATRAADDDGAVAILVALLLIVLVGFGAFAVDMGYAYAVKRQQSVTVDAAALAGAQAVGIEYRRLFPKDGPGCTPTTADQVWGAAQAAAIANYRANAPQNSSGDPVVPTPTCDGTNFNVTVKGESTLPTILGGVLPSGISTLKPGAVATAQVSGSPAYSGLRPFAICEQDLAKAIANPGSVQYSTFTFQQSPPDEACTPGSPGNWGIVDFTGSNGAPGQTNVNDWIENGYGGAVSIPTDLQGDPGGTGSMDRHLKTLLGKTVLFPVAEANWTGGGSQAEFPAVGVVSAKFCGWYNGNGANKSGAIACGDGLGAKSEATILAEMSAAHPNNGLVLAWQYSAHTGSYEGSGSTVDCSLTDDGCVPTIRLWR